MVEQSFSLSIIEFSFDILVTMLDFRFLPTTTRSHVDHDGEKVAKRSRTARVRVNFRFLFG